MMENIQSLLNEITAIRKSHEEQAQLTGENFNVFSIINMQYDEVNTHSAMLCELLNPKGSHGSGDVFLKLFLENLNYDGKLDTENAYIKKEYFAGKIDNEAITGGRIDVYIKDTLGNEIVIENKIYAGDQDNQLTRYKNTTSNSKIYYLTLYGIEPSNKSVNNSEVIYWTCISYKENILKWLDNCHKEATSKPIVRETIKQYIHLIQKLTNKSTNKIMSSKIIEKIIENENNLVSSFEIWHNVELAKKELAKKLMVQIKERQLENDLFLCEKSDLTLPKYPNIVFRNQKLNKKNISIRFEFLNNDFHNLIFGFHINNKEIIENNFFNKLFNNFKQRFPNVIKNHAWVAFNHNFENNRWHREEYKKIINNTLANEIVELVNQVYEIFEVVLNDISYDKIK